MKRLIICAFIIALFPVVGFAQISGGGITGSTTNHPHSRLVGGAITTNQDLIITNDSGTTTCQIFHNSGTISCAGGGPSLTGVNLQFVTYASSTVAIDSATPAIDLTITSPVVAYQIADSSASNTFQIARTSTGSAFLITQTASLGGGIEFADAAGGTDLIDEYKIGVLQNSANRFRVLRYVGTTSNFETLVHVENKNATTNAETMKLIRQTGTGSNLYVNGGAPAILVDSTAGSGDNNAVQINQGGTQIPTKAALRISPLANTQFYGIHMDPINATVDGPDSASNSIFIHAANKLQDIVEIHHFPAETDTAQNHAINIEQTFRPITAAQTWGSNAVGGINIQIDNDYSTATGTNVANGLRIEYATATATGYPIYVESLGTGDFVRFNDGSNDMFTVDKSGNVTAAGSMVFSGATVATLNATTVNGATVNAGGLNASGTLSVTGAATSAIPLLEIGGGYGDTGTSILSNGDVWINGKLNVDGAIDPTNIVLSGNTAVAIVDITQAGAGNDIEGTGNTWTISKTGSMLLPTLLSNSIDASQSSVASLTTGTITASGTFRAPTVIANAGSFTSINGATINAGLLRASATADLGTVNATVLNSPTVNAGAITASGTANLGTLNSTVINSPTINGAAIAATSSITTPTLLANTINATTGNVATLASNAISATGSLDITAGSAASWASAGATNTVIIDSDACGTNNGGCVILKNWDTDTVVFQIEGGSTGSTSDDIMIQGGPDVAGGDVAWLCNLDDDGRYCFWQNSAGNIPIVLAARDVGALGINAGLTISDTTTDLPRFFFDADTSVLTLSDSATDVYVFDAPNAKATIRSHTVIGGNTNEYPAGGANYPYDSTYPLNVFDNVAGKGWNLANISGAPNNKCSYTKMDALGGSLQAGTADDTLCSFYFTGNNSASAADKSYSHITGKIDDPTAGSEDGRLEFYILEGGADTEYFELDGTEGEVNFSKPIDVTAAGTSSIALLEVGGPYGGTGIALDASGNGWFDGDVTIDGDLNLAGGITGITQEKNIAFNSLGTSINYLDSSFYIFSGTNSDFDPQVSNFGTANAPYSAHVGVVCSADAATSSLVLTVTGTTFTDAGVRTGSDTDTITIIVGEGQDEWHETAKRFSGQVDIAWTSGASQECNYGFAKYWDDQNTDFTWTGVEAGFVGGHASNFNLQVWHHKKTGWDYNAGADPTPPAPLADFQVDNASTEITAANGVSGSWKHIDQSVLISGSGSEGLLFSLTASNTLTIDQGNMSIYHTD